VRRKIMSKGPGGRPTKYNEEILEKTKQYLIATRGEG